MVEQSVLVVEDEGIVAKNLENLIEKNGYEVIDTVPTGEGALEIVDAEKPDLVLMDIRLGGELDGTETAQRIFDEYSIPIVYLTAHSDPETVQQAEETEPFGFLTK
ncbi:MAG: response regulator, partial [bacterium]